MASPDARYFVGQGVKVTLNFKVPDSAGTLTSPTSVTLTVKNEDGTTLTPTVVNASTGVYTATFVWTKKGLWYLAGTGTGTVNAVVEDSVYVDEVH